MAVLPMDLGKPGAENGVVVQKASGEGTGKEQCLHWLLLWLGRAAGKMGQARCRKGFEGSESNAKGWEAEQERMGLGRKNGSEKGEEGGG